MFVACVKRLAVCFALRPASARPPVADDKAALDTVTGVVVGNSDVFGRCSQRRSAGSGWGSLPEEIAERLFQLLAEGAGAAIGSVRRVNRHWKVLAALHTRHLGTYNASSAGSRSISLRAVTEDAMPKAMSESLGRLLSSFPYLTEVRLELANGMAYTLKALDQLRELKHLSSIHLEGPAPQPAEPRQDASAMCLALSSLAGFTDLSSLSLRRLGLIQSLSRQQPCAMPPKLTSLVLEDCTAEESTLGWALETGSASGLKRLTLEVWRPLVLQRNSKGLGNGGGRGRGLGFPHEPIDLTLYLCLFIRTALCISPRERPRHPNSSARSAR